jgi:deoxyribodipyrimidine photolyase-like uncharacterized protein
MFKLIVMTKRKAGMSMEDFIDYYENGHSVLMKSFYPQMRKYVRNYLYTVTNDMCVDGEMPYDCVTEAYFDDEAAWLDVVNKMAADPEKTALHAADEENLFDRSKIAWFTTKVCETQF